MSFTKAAVPNKKQPRLPGRLFDKGAGLHQRSSKRGCRRVEGFKRSGFESFRYARCLKVFRDAFLASTDTLPGSVLCEFKAGAQAERADCDGDC